VGHDQRQPGLPCHRVTHLFLVEPQRLGPVIAHTYGTSEMGLVSALTPPEGALSRATTTK
jgi:hypothetical protein